MAFIRSSSNLVERPYPIENINHDLLNMNEEQAINKARSLGCETLYAYHELPKNFKRFYACPDARVYKHKEKSNVCIINLSGHHKINWLTKSTFEIVDE